ncbi:hypothetical protein SAICODRAFT_20311 [Saitoella complicata NRRL Y-17804]|uniref:uncharacterized protein n=1 Tax=Saitoella complicata (strain BCRC 22490 / CBS 7301 / JCM 7358 / NBRC 10748 / NRRL Y-17804) TaxID=698492 RepID=UPI0008675B50|nr:uncharacterized protein SAICODRAFT_20311 [Saitoella complicata NRRL Y-17804]ODQ51999.1 hypothetical protein SAICODRAFT_20311 [Saitoella complicata NRRL Y-17804]
MPIATAPQRKRTGIAALFPVRKPSVPVVRRAGSLSVRANDDGEERDPDVFNRRQKLQLLRNQSSSQVDEDDLEILEYDLAPLPLPQEISDVLAGLSYLLTHRYPPFDPSRLSRGVVASTLNMRRCMPDVVPVASIRALLKDGTMVEREVSRLAAEGRVRVLEMRALGQGELGVCEAPYYLQQVKTRAEELEEEAARTGKEETMAAVDALRAFAEILKMNPTGFPTANFPVNGRLEEGQLRHLITQGFLALAPHSTPGAGHLPLSTSTPYTFSHPYLGLLIRHSLLGRQHIIRSITRNKAKTKAGVVLESMLKEKVGKECGFGVGWGGCCGSVLEGGGWRLCGRLSGGGLGWEGGGSDWNRERDVH